MTTELKPEWVVKCPTCGRIADPETRKIRHVATEPTPSMEQLEEWVYDSVCEATDGCIVEPDGRCPHGHQSWLLRLGLI